MSVENSKVFSCEMWRDCPSVLLSQCATKVEESTHQFCCTQAHAPRKFWLIAVSEKIGRQHGEVTWNNRTPFKTLAKFCNTVVAATSFLMPILAPMVLVTLQSSETNTKSTKIGIKNDVAATTVLQNFATVLNWVLLIMLSHILALFRRFGMRILLLMIGDRHRRCYCISAIEFVLLSYIRDIVHHVCE